MKIKDLLAQFGDLSAIHPVDVEFNKAVGDLESYAEPKMRATITAVTDDHDDVVIVRVDYIKYDDYNKSFESYNYYDSNHQAVLNARQANYYTVKDSLYVMANDEVDKYFSILSGHANELYEMYQAGGRALSYTAWLESYIAVRRNQ